ncbi:MAG: M28 family peptidase [Vicinamibacterales bacterium]|nr:M28 family peptidase [Vicinamibacterales bacterium]
MCLGLVFSVGAMAQPTSIKVDGGVIKGYITYLAADEQQGRRTLTPGYERMADWAAGKFKEWGLEPAGEKGTYFQGVPMAGARSSFVWTTGIPTLSVGGRAFSLRDSDFTVDTQSTPGTNVNAEVVFVGYGISAPAKGLDEYAGLDVKGKIVLALKGSPSAAADPRPSMGGAAPVPAPQPAKEEWAEESTDQQKALTAYGKGAAAILLYTAPAGGGGLFGGPAAAAPVPAAMGGLRRPVDESPFKKPFLFVSTIDDRVFRAVMWRDPQESIRGFGARLAQIQSDIKAKKARSMKTGVMAQIKGYTTATLYGEKFKNHVGRNVIAKITGTDPALKAQYVIVGGHLDHVGVTNGVIFNGADDNASGSAVTMEVARLFAVNKVQPKRTMIFCLWTGEEQGLLGSNYYGANPSDGVSMDRVVGYFNLDMVALGDRIGAPGALNFPAIWDVIKRDQLPEVIGVVDPSTAGPGGSDYSAFIERGIQALGLMTSGGAGHPDYHDAGDDAAKSDAAILGKTGQFVLQGMWNLANETAVNLLIPDRQVQYDAMRFAAPSVNAAVAGSWQYVRPSTREELVAAIGQRLRDLSSGRGADAGGRAMGGRRGGNARIATGVRGAGVFGGSIALLEAGAAALNIGRVDVASPDGVWFGETVTHEGKAALKAMETAGVVLHLVQPAETLLVSVLDSATKPILVTGVPSWTPAVMAKVKKNNALAVVECEAGDVAGAVRQIDAAQKALGKANVLISVGPSETRADGLKALYLALLNAGWTKPEINAAVGVGAPGMMGVPAPGNLARFPASPGGVR